MVLILWTHFLSLFCQLSNLGMSWVAKSDFFKPPSVALFNIWSKYFYVLILPLVLSSPTHFFLDSNSSNYFKNNIFVG